MFSIKSFIYLGAILTLLIAIDGVFSVKEIHQDVVFEKKHPNNIVKAGGGTRGKTPFTPIPSEGQDQNNLLLIVKSESNEIIRIKCAAEIYYNTKSGDSIIYYKYKGRITNILWNTKTKETKPQSNKNRKEDSNKQKSNGLFDQLIN